MCFPLLPLAYPLSPLSLPVSSYAQVLDPGWDLQYYILERHEQVKAEEARSSTAVVLAKVKFEELKAKGITLCLKSRQTQVRERHLGPAMV